MGGRRRRKKQARAKARASRAIAANKPVVGGINTAVAKKDVASKVSQSKKLSKAAPKKKRKRRRGLFGSISRAIGGIAKGVGKAVGTVAKTGSKVAGGALKTAGKVGSVTASVAGSPLAKQMKNMKSTTVGKKKRRRKRGLFGAISGIFKGAGKVVKGVTKGVLGKKGLVSGVLKTAGKVTKGVGKVAGGVVGGLGKAVSSVLKGKRPKAPVKKPLIVKPPPPPKPAAPEYAKRSTRDWSKNTFANMEQDASVKKRGRNRTQVLGKNIKRPTRRRRTANRDRLV
tara:strand:+ start:1626 stop:2477 length:852 start_codon:yes stop_codon:yes gene_type:complete